MTKFYDWVKLIGLIVAGIVVVAVVIVIAIVARAMTPYTFKTDVNLQPEGIRVAYVGKLSDFLMDPLWDDERVILTRGGHRREISLTGTEGGGKYWSGRINIYRTAQGDVGVIVGDSPYVSRASDLASLDDTVQTPDDWVYAGAFDWKPGPKRDSYGQPIDVLTYISPQAMKECLGYGYASRGDNVPPEAPPFRADKWADCKRQ